jgi:hypothetical protein
MHGCPVSEITLSRALETTCDDRHVCWSRPLGQRKAPPRQGLRFH